MAIWEMRVVMQFNDRKWENVYHLDIGSATDIPPDVINSIVNFYSDNLLSIYTLVEVARRPAGTTNEFITAVFDIAGTRAIGSDVAAPLFNTVRLLLEGGVGRNGSKYLRGFLKQADLLDSEGNLNPTIVSGIETAFLSFLNDCSAQSVSLVVGTLARPVVTAAVQALIQERQRHRKRRRSA